MAISTASTIVVGDPIERHDLTFPILDTNPALETAGRRLHLPVTGLDRLRPSCLFPRDEWPCLSKPFTSIVSRHLLLSHFLPGPGDQTNGGAGRAGWRAGRRPRGPVAYKQPELVGRSNQRSQAYGRGRAVPGVGLDTLSRHSRPDVSPA